MSFRTRFYRERNLALALSFLMLRKWYVYIITNYRNTVFYTGITNDLNRRMYEHKRGIIKNAFSHKYRLYKLLWYEEFNNPEDAISAEKIVKDYRRDKKLNLIKTINSQLRNLFALRQV